MFQPSIPGDAVSCPACAQPVARHWTLAFDGEQAQEWIDNELVCALTQDEVTDLITKTSEGNHEETDEASGDS